MSKRKLGAKEIHVKRDIVLVLRNGKKHLMTREDYEASKPDAA